MEINSTETELQSIEKKLLVAKLIGMLGAVALGLGITGMYAPKAVTTLPFLSDDYVVKGLIVAGIALCAWMLVTTAPLFKQKKQLQDQKSA